MRIIYFLSILTTLLLSLNIYADNSFSFKNFSVDNSLSYQSVRSITQDRDGFIWLGTQEGVQRFDGYQSINFYHDKNKPNSLTSNEISKILIDSNDKVWIATRGGGINVYQKGTDDFHHITSETESLALNNNNVNIIIEDRNGHIWAGTEDGLNIIFREKEKWHIKLIRQELGNPNSLSNNMVETLLQTLSGDIWVGTSGGGVSIFDLDGKFKRSIKLVDENNLTAKLIKALYQDKQGNIWIGTSDRGIFKFNVTTKEMIHYEFDENDENSIGSNFVSDIQQDSTGKIIIATDRGLMVYQDDKDNFIRITHSITNPFSITTDFVLTIFEDKNKMIWIGTFSGVSRWDPYMTTFSQYNDPNHPEVASSLVLNFGQLDENNIVISTYSKGLYKFSNQNNEIKPLLLNNLFKNYRVMTMLVDGRTLWVGTRASGLFEYDLDSNKYKVYQNSKNDPYSLSANSVTDIIKDKDGNIWISTYHRGINRLKKDGNFERFEVLKNSSSNTPSSNHILMLLEDHLGYIWLGTYEGGLNRFNPKTKKFIHLKNDPGNKKSLSGDVAWVMTQDRENNLWIGTQAEGLNLLRAEDLNNENYVFSHYNLDDGMKDQTIWGIVEDESGKLWFSTNKGISRLSPKNAIFKHFGTRHGLIDLEYNHGASFIDSNGIIYFGSAKGFTSVDPKFTSAEQSAPIVRLTDIHKLNEAMTFDTSLSQLTSITFDYSDQLVSFDYVGLNYSDPRSTRYKYRLLGLNDEWIDAGKARRATYTNLPQGTYQLQIIAGNSDDVWSEPYQLEVVMNPAPWNTWWAYLLYAIFIAIALLTYSRLLNKKLVIEQQQKKNLEQQVIAKTKDYQEKNVELEQANKQLENAAIIDKVTGVKSRRYLDIYIEQASQLMNQIHQNIMPVQRSTLPRLYVLMVEVSSIEEVTSSQLVNLTDLLLFSRNTDDLVIRWSEDTFAIIGYEKGNNITELAARLSSRFKNLFAKEIPMHMAYSFYPFNIEQPVDISWDQISVMIELGLKLSKENSDIAWLGLCQPKVQPFDYLAVMQKPDLTTLKSTIEIKQG